MAAPVATTFGGAVEGLGFGYGQLLAVGVSAAGVFLCDGAGLQAMNIAADQVSREFGTSAGLRALLPTADTFGLMLGALAAGRYGDVIGRQRPILLSYLGMSIFGLLSCLAPTFCLLLAFRVCFGFSMGFGWPPSIALASEVTPVQWKMAVRAGSQICFPFGQLLVLLFAYCDSRTLAFLHWRALLALYALIPIVLLALARRWLPESPVFLFAAGRHAEAKAELKLIAQRNGAAVADYDAPAEGAEGAGAKGGTSVGLIAVVTSGRYLGPLLAVALMSLTLNLTMYGGMYAFPLILSEASSPATTPSVVTLMRQSFVAMASAPLAFLVGTCLSRRRALLLSLGVLIACTALLGVLAGVRPPRGAAQEAAFQLLMAFNPVGILIGFTIMYQVSVEIFPPHAVTTGASLIVAIGRLGACSAALVFEGMQSLFGVWQAFIVLLTLMQLASFVAISSVTIEAHSLDGRAGSEEDKLERHAGKGYGAASAS